MRRIIKTMKPNVVNQTIIVEANPLVPSTTTVKEKISTYPWVNSDAKFFHYTELKAQTFSCSGKPNVYPNDTPIIGKVAATVCYQRSRLDADRDRLVLGWAFCSTSDRKAYNRATGRRIAWERMHSNPQPLIVKSDASPPTAALDFLHSRVEMLRSQCILEEVGYTGIIIPTTEGIPRWYKLDISAQKLLFAKKKGSKNAP